MSPPRRRHAAPLAVLLALLVLAPTASAVSIGSGVRIGHTIPTAYDESGNPTAWKNTTYLVGADGMSVDSLTFRGGAPVFDGTTLDLRTGGNWTIKSYSPTQIVLNRTSGGDAGELRLSGAYKAYLVYGLSSSVRLYPHQYVMVGADVTDITIVPVQSTNVQTITAVSGVIGFVLVMLMLGMGVGAIVGLGRRS